MTQQSLVGPADPRWHTVAAPVRVAVRPAATTPGRWARVARLLRWTRSDRAQLVAFEAVTGHVGARYLMSEASTIVATGAPRHAGRLAHAAGSWAAALESLGRPSATHRLPAPLRAELADLASVVRRLESAAEAVHHDDSAGAARARLLVAVDGYAAGVRAFWRRHEAALARLRDAA